MYGGQASEASPHPDGTSLLPALFTLILGEECRHWNTRGCRLEGQSMAPRSAQYGHTLAVNIPRVALEVDDGGGRDAIRPLLPHTNQKNQSSAAGYSEGFLMVLSSYHA